MLHFTIDGVQGFRRKFDDLSLIHEVLAEVPLQLGLQPSMPPFVLPYYDGAVPEDGGVSGFVFLDGGHFTLHTFSRREAYFADLVAPQEFQPPHLRARLEAAFPCAVTGVHTLDRRALADREPDLGADFGPHLFLNIEGYQGPHTLDGLFTLLDRLPDEIGMTPIMRPYVIRNTKANGHGTLSAMAMIAESHMSLHVFPDEARAYFDLFSCAFFDRDTVVPKLKVHLPGARIHEALMARGRKYRFLWAERTDEHARSRSWLRARHDAVQ